MRRSSPIRYLLRGGGGSEGGGDDWQFGGCGFRVYNRWVGVGVWCSIIIMEEQNEYRTMYIKFPTVTKLTYPSLPNDDTPLRATQSFRQNFIRKTQIKLDLVRAAESFKIVQLPPRGDIINICTMTVQPKERGGSPRERDSAGKGSSDAKERKERVKKAFSVSKLAALKESSSSANPLKFRSTSIKDLRRPTLPLPMVVDYFQVYPQVARLLALSMGVTVVNQGAHRQRRARVDVGNNGLLVRQTIKKRLWWAAAEEHKERKEEEETKPNLLWTTQILPRRQLERAIEANEACLRACDPAEEAVFQRSFERALQQLPRIQQLLWTEWQGPVRVRQLLGRLERRAARRLFPEEAQLLNHLPNHFEITNKKLLYRNMADYYRSQGQDPHSRLPRTHLLTCFDWQTVLNDIRGDERMWILKPGEFSNRGRGISVFRSTREAVQGVLGSPPVSEERSLVLQEYIAPLLYEQRKLDVRCFMLGVEAGGELRFYWFEEGYVRTASEKFSTKRTCRGVHLTNDAVQKHLPNYDRFEPANKLSFAELDRYTRAHSPFHFYPDVLPAIKALARDVCLAVGPTRRIGAGKGLAFEIFGLDFLVDSGGKPWLCEVNTNPSLEVCCSLLSRIIPELIENTFRLVVDLFLPPRKTPDYAQSFLTGNKYSLLYANAD